MMDEETESHWSHLLGKAMRGPLEGEELGVIPSMMSDWGAWRKSRPHTTLLVMSRTADGYRNRVHRQPRDLLIGLAVGDEAKAWDLKAVHQLAPINDRVGDTDVLVVYHEPSGTPLIYDRQLDGETLTFETVNGQLVDREAGSAWDELTGEALTAPRQGKRLKLLPGVVSGHHAWHNFHPTTVLIQDDSPREPDPGSVPSDNRAPSDDLQSGGDPKSAPPKSE